MDEKELKTSFKQRVMVGVVAFLLLASTVAVYAAIVLSGNKSAEETAMDSEEAMQLQTQMAELSTKMEEKNKEFAEKYFNEMKEYKDKVRSYNATTVNSDGLKSEDLKMGGGAEITTEMNDYYAYYIGWCSDEKVFDSSFDNYENPTTLKDPLSGQMGLIAGWTEGVQGMKIGGARILTIPSELGYGETDSADNACGKGNPMKFIVRTFDPGDEYRDLYKQYTEAYYQLMMSAQ